MSRLSDYMERRGLTDRDLADMMETREFRPREARRMMIHGIKQRTIAERYAALLGCDAMTIWEHGEDVKEDPMLWESDTPGMAKLLDVLTNDLAFTAFTGIGLAAARRKWRHIGRNWNVSWNDPRRQGW